MVCFCVGLTCIFRRDPLLSPDVFFTLPSSPGSPLQGCRYAMRILRRSAGFRSRGRTHQTGPCKHMLIAWHYSDATIGREYLLYRLGVPMWFRRRIRTTQCQWPSAMCSRCIIWVYHDRNNYCYTRSGDEKSPGQWIHPPVMAFD